MEPLGVDYAGMSDAMPDTGEDLKNLHVADLADRLQRLKPAQARTLLEQLPPERAATVLAEMEPERLPEVLRTFAPGQLRALLQQLPAAECADLLEDLKPGLRREMIDSLPPLLAEGVRTLLRYPPDTAGGIMSNRFIALRDTMTVEQAREMLRTRAETERSEDVAYLYVTDAQQRLVGIIGLRDLVFRRGDRLIVEIMNREVKAVRADMDQEALAREFDHYHYLGLPVINENGQLVGVAKATDALEIARREATEDMQLMVGLSGEERALTSWRKSVGYRLPWLLINLATAFLAAWVVGLFEDTIAKWTALAIFLPIVAGQGGNAGMQTLTVVIRDLALGELSAGEGRRVLLKELTAGLVNGLAIGLVVGAMGYLWKGNATLGIVALTAMLLNQIAAVIAGVTIPLGLKAMRVDPALASSIFLTTVTDVAGFFFFLGLATLALRWGTI